MSYTEIYGVPPKGEIELIGEVHNAHRGAMFIWNRLWESHLSHVGSFAYLSHRDPEEMGLLWDLWRTDIPEHHKVCLISTFDWCMVKRENLDRLKQAFALFDSEFNNSNLPGQIKVLTGLPSKYIAVCWNQTSVNTDAWLRDIVLEDEDPDDWKMYDVSICESHFFLFDFLNEGKNE